MVQDKGIATPGRGGKRQSSEFGDSGEKLMKGNKTSGTPKNVNYKNWVELKVSYNAFLEVKHCTHVKVGLDTAVKRLVEA